MRYISLLIFSPLFAIVLWSLWRRGERALAQAREWRERATATERDAAEHLRLLRAGGMELREQGLSLLGQSEVGGHQRAVEWGAIAARLLSMADDMQDHAPPSPESRVLARERIAAGPLVEQCVAAVAASLRPSSRLWRIAPELNDLELFADRRALSQVLVRVLSNAARATRNQDWIEIGVEQSHDRITLTIQDEGSGLLGPSSRQPGDGRGFGLGLAVARSLIEAHGGGLAVESVTGIGARVEVSLPPPMVASG